MKDLTIIQDEEVVTSSLNISESFEKRHDNVLRDVDNLKKDVLNFEEMFFESNMQDSYGRERRVYYMNRDGFTLLAMGFNGKKATHFKLKYISAFNQMERKLKEQLTEVNKKLSPELQFMNSVVRALTTQEMETKKLKAEMGAVRQEMKQLSGANIIGREGNMTLEKTAKATVLELLGGNELSDKYRDNYRKVFRELWREFHIHFGVRGYGYITFRQYPEALNFIKNWGPDYELLIELDAYSRRMRQKGSY